MALHLVHGIREFKPETHMDALADQLASRNIAYNHVTYGPVWIPITNEKAVNAVLEEVDDGDDIVAFSNGAWAAHQAVELGLKVRNLYLISPALNVKAAFPGVERVIVYYSGSDTPTLLAKWYRKATSKLLPWRWRKPHGWGAMGRYGHEGDAENIVSYDMGSAVGHQFYDHPNVLAMIANDIELGLP